MQMRDYLIFFPEVTGKEHEHSHDFQTAHEHQRAQ
jgi:hypothetical protein